MPEVWLQMIVGVPLYAVTVGIAMGFMRGRIGEPDLTFVALVWPAFVPLVVIKSIMLGSGVLTIRAIRCWRTWRLDVKTRPARAAPLPRATVVK